MSMNINFLQQLGVITKYRSLPALPTKRGYQPSLTHICYLVCQRITPDNCLVNLLAAVK